MALQYWRGLGRRGKAPADDMARGFHGDTFTPMSVCDPDGGIIVWSTCWCVRCSRRRCPPGTGRPVPPHWKSKLASAADELAAVMVEPAVQGAGGNEVPRPALLVDLRDMCRRHDVLLIFRRDRHRLRRTGELFAADHAGVTPDIMCVGKALTGGLHHAGRHAMYRGDRADHQQPRSWRVDARPHVHGQCAGLRGVRGVGGAVARPGLAVPGGRDRGGADCGAGNAQGVADVLFSGAIGVVEMRRPVISRWRPPSRWTTAFGCGRSAPDLPNCRLICSPARSSRSPRPWSPHRPTPRRRRRHRLA